MKKISFKVSLGGIIAALSLICMFFTGIIPVLSYTLPAIAGILMIVIVIEINIKWALLTYSCIGMLSLFLTPDKESAVLFIMFFGYYPIIKSFLERIKNRLIEWILKIASFNFSIFLSYLMLINILGLKNLIDEFNQFGKYSIFIFVAFANIVFVLYDIALTRIISVYINYFRSKIFKNLK